MRLESHTSLIPLITTQLGLNVEGSGDDSLDRWVSNHSNWEPFRQICETEMQNVNMNQGVAELNHYIPESILGGAKRKGERPTVVGTVSDCNSSCSRKKRSSNAKRECWAAYCEKIGREREPGRVWGMIKKTKRIWCLVQRRTRTRQRSQHKQMFTVMRRKRLTTTSSHSSGYRCSLHQARKEFCAQEVQDKDDICHIKSDKLSESS